MAERKIRVLVADGNTLFRACLTAVLDRDVRLQVVGSAASCEETLSLVERHRPDVALIDRNLGGVEVRNLVVELAGSPHVVAVVALGVSEEEPEFLDWIECGARACAGWDHHLRELIERIVEVGSGRVCCSPRALRIAAEHLSFRAESRTLRRRYDLLPLSPRELLILELVSSGLSNREIADRLRLSFHTVKNHMHNILSKLEVRRRLDAVLYAQRMQWLSPGLAEVERPDP